MTSQRVLLHRIRRITTVVAILGLGYLVVRFDLMMLPKDRCSPLVRFDPGDRLIVDGHPSSVGPGDAILVRTRSGVVVVTRVQALREEDGAVWCTTDNPDCPGLRSEEAGWISTEAIAGRVLLAWNF